MGICSLKDLTGNNSLMVVVFLHLLALSPVLLGLMVFEVWCEGLSSKHITTMPFIPQNIQD